MGLKLNENKTKYLTTRERQNMEILSAVILNFK